MDVGSVKAANRAGEGRKQPFKKMSGKTATFDMQGAAMSGKDDEDGVVQGVVSVGGGYNDGSDAARQGGQANVRSDTTGWVVLTVDERKELKKLKERRRHVKSPAAKQGMQHNRGNDKKERHARHLASLTRP